jgi:hypothetical protein
VNINIQIILCVKSTQNIWWFEKSDLPLRKNNIEAYEEHGKNRCDGW